MGTFSTTAKDAMLDALTVDRLSLHSGDPGAAGTSNELTEYTRGTAVYNSADGGKRELDEDVIIDVPASSTVAWVGKWDHNDGSPVFMGADQVSSEAFTEAGQYRVKGTDSYLQVVDPD